MRHGSPDTPAANRPLRIPKHADEAASKAQPQHPHLKTTPKRRHGRPAPSPSRTPRVGTAALAAHAGSSAFIRPPGPAPIGRPLSKPTSYQQDRPESLCLGRPIRKALPGGGSRCKGSGGARNPPPGGGFPLPAPLNVLASYFSNFFLQPPKTFRLPNPQTLSVSIPKHGPATEKGLHVQVFGLIQTFPVIGKTRATNAAAVHSFIAFLVDVSRRTPFLHAACSAPPNACISRETHEARLLSPAGSGSPSGRDERHRCACRQARSSGARTAGRKRAPAESCLLLQCGFGDANWPGGVSESA